MSSGKVEAVVAIVERDGRFLMGKRSAHKASAPGYWCPISGRVERGESQAAAVVREVREETGLNVIALARVAECDSHDGTTVLHWWRTELLDRAPARLENDEHSELRWVSAEEMQRLEPVFSEDVAILLSVAQTASQKAGRPGHPG
jgi:8-oxo-dGTP pyrophosphatase MutT (NUDIX family)